MSSYSSWEKLDLGLADTPKLLVRSDFASSGYDVQLTDLSHIWTEKLSKRDIIRRAWDDNSSIDPSEDDEQFRIFIGKIESALKRDDGTSISMLPKGDHDLCLSLTAPLPKPLPSFTWSIFLARRPAEALAGALTIPLIHHTSSLQDQVQQLIHELHEKDRVISKITDRLETSGNDLTTVFPGVSNIKTNKKRSQREQLAKHVRGLADFDEASWRGKASVGAGVDGMWQRLDRVLERLPGPEGGLDVNDTEKKWWLDLPDNREQNVAINRNQSSARISPKAEKPAALSRDESLVEDEFQRQGTPEYLRHRSSAQTGDEHPTVVSRPASAGRKSPARLQDAVVEDGDSTTEDEDDLDAVPSDKAALNITMQQPRAQIDSLPASTPKKLGAIGGRSTKPSLSPTAARPPTEQPQSPKLRSKLGAIGGKAKAHEERQEPIKAEEDSAPSSSTIRKMGVIGGKRKPSNSIPPVARSPDATPSPEPVRSRSRAPTKEPTPPPRDTSQERADRKRVQLKKELEQKAKAPAKKKRKF